VGNSTSTPIGTSDTDVLSTQITLTANSLIEANAMVNLAVASGDRIVNCYIKVDGTDISTLAVERLLNADSETIPVVGAINNQPAGLRTAKAGCVSTATVAGTVTYGSGNLNVIAVG